MIMDYPITIERVEKILGKRRLALVEEIFQDSEVTEIVLKYPYANTHWEETVHVFPHDHFASWDAGSTLTVADYRAELLDWFDSVAEDPNNRNYLNETERDRLAGIKAVEKIFFS